MDTAKPADDYVDLDVWLSGVCDELHLRNLNEMLPASEPTAFGLATYFGERLRLALPSVTRVDVEMEDMMATTEWVIR